MESIISQSYKNISNAVLYTIEAQNHVNVNVNVNVNEIVILPTAQEW